MDHFALLHPELREHARNIHTVLSALGRTRNWEAKIVHSYRSPEAQDELYRKGREQRDGKWAITHPNLVVTHAMAIDSAHCVLVSGKPASCAVDFALLRDGKYLPDDHLAWTLIPGIAASSAPEGKLEWGGYWHRIRDLGHLQLRNWRQYENPQVSV